jgi:hypothetical protein
VLDTRRPCGEGGYRCEYEDTHQKESRAALSSIRPNLMHSRTSLICPEA